MLPTPPATHRRSTQVLCPQQPLSVFLWKGIPQDLTSQEFRPEPNDLHSGWPQKSFHLSHSEPHLAAAGPSRRRQLRALRIALYVADLRVRHRQAPSGLYPRDRSTSFPGQEEQVTETPNTWQARAFPALAYFAGAFMNRQ